MSMNLEQCPKYSLNGQVFQFQNFVSLHLANLPHRFRRGLGLRLKTQLKYFSSTSIAQNFCWFSNKVWLNFGFSLSYSTETLSTRPACSRREGDRDLVKSVWRLVSKSKSRTSLENDNTTSTNACLPVARITGPAPKIFICKSLRPLIFIRVDKPVFISERLGRFALDKKIRQTHPIISSF